MTVKKIRKKKLIVINKQERRVCQNCVHTDATRKNRWFRSIKSLEKYICTLLFLVDYICDSFKNQSFICLYPHLETNHQTPLSPHIVLPLNLDIFRNLKLDIIRNCTVYSSFEPLIKLLKVLDIEVKLWYRVDINNANWSSYFCVCAYIYTDIIFVLSVCVYAIL